ncbi:MAG TPA: hypothetical protein VK835_13030 [Bacteroidia bacterium]|jgi:hypothetical protein|nr:hypothetical protein [Bacteroidia bacterium]
MKPQFKTFEEAEKALNEYSSLKSKEIIENETGKKRVVSSLVIFPYIMFEDNREEKLGYDVVVYFKSEMKYVLLHELTRRFSMAPARAVIAFA